MGEGTGWTSRTSVTTFKTLSCSLGKIKRTTLVEKKNEAKKMSKEAGPEMSTNTKVEQKPCGKAAQPFTPTGTLNFPPLPPPVLCPHWATA